MFRYNQRSQRIYERATDGRLDNKEVRQSGRGWWMASQQFSSYWYMQYHERYLEPDGQRSLSKACIFYTMRQPWITTSHERYHWNNMVFWSILVCSIRCYSLNKSPKQLTLLWEKRCNAYNGKKRAFILSVLTRWGTQVHMIESVSRNLQALQDLCEKITGVNSALSWKNYFGTPRSGKKSTWLITYFSLFMIFSTALKKTVTNYVM